MNKTVFFFFLSFLSYLSVHGQILNIEDERIKTDTTGWGGKTRISLTYQKTDVDFFKSDAYAHVQYKTKRSLYLILADYSLSKGNGKEFTNASTQHLRYNYKLTPFVTAEAFVQGQFNKVLDVKFRILAGAGPRLPIIKKQNIRVYLGVLYMLESEYLTTNINNLTSRLSNYLSFSLFLNDNAALIHTTYFQPALNNFSDFRILSQSALKINFTKHFSFSFQYKYYFDSNPPPGIISETHFFSNGIEYSF